MERELQRLDDKGIIYKVSGSDWAAPVALVPKKDGSLRVCGDYKTTLNPCAGVDQYPLPIIEDLFATVAGGQVSSKIDLSHAYQQVQLNEDSLKYLTVNTHRGLYCYKRLSLGVSSAPAILQRTMDQLLQGVKFTVCRLDDILISGGSAEEHFAILEEVFRRLQEHSIKLNPARCIFFQSGLEFLGHWIDKNGIRPLPQKMDALMQAKSPTNVTELKSYLRLLNCYGNFLPDLATTLHPLHDLLQKDRSWTWTEAYNRAFVKSKKQLQDSPLLVHYDLKKSLWLACDASPYGVGAVISHVMENGEEKPIAFASRTLKASECNYSQIEREALSIVFGVKRFHSYLYGRGFTLLTDHQPLVTILGPKVGVPPLAATRMQRWSLILAAYQYEIEYRESAEHANADALSRLVLNAAIVERVQQCHVCAALGTFPSRAPLYPWKWPAKRWERIHIDFFEKGKLNLLVVIDAYTKWLEVIPMGSMTSLKTI